MAQKAPASDRPIAKSEKGRPAVPSPDDLAGISSVQKIIDLLCRATNFSVGIAGTRTLQGPTHVRKFCNMVRSSPSGLMKCMEADMSVVDRAMRQESSTITRCHAGLVELACPIFLSGRPVAVLFAGQVRPQEEVHQGSGGIAQLASELDLPADALVEAYRQIPIVPNMAECAELAGQASEIISDLVALALHDAAPARDPSDFLATVSIVDWLRSSKQRTVLILGKDAPPEIEYLREIQRIVSDHGYRPVLVKDYQDIEAMSNEQKVVAFAQAARFVIIENTFPAGQIDECRLCASNRVVAGMLRQKGRGSSFMVTDYDLDFPFMKEFEYLSHGQSRGLSMVVPKVLRWAEKTLEKRALFFQRKYPWRRQNHGSPGQTV